MTSDLLERHGTEFRHEALLYADSTEFLSALTGFVREAIAAGEPALVLLPAGRLALLRENVPDCPWVEYLDMLEAGRNPARLISIWLDFVHARATPGLTVRGVVEPVWPERSPDELEECRIHEILLGIAFDGRNPWTLLCPYDTASLDPAVVERARRSHPDGEGPTRTPVPAEPASLLDGALTPAPRDATHFVFDAGRLRDLRRLVNRAAERVGMGFRSEDLVLAVNEVATNSLAYGGGRGQLRLWAIDGGMICEVVDRGHIRDPLAGRRRPPNHRRGGLGLWLANQVCDLVQIRSRPEGTVVRLHMHSP